MLGYDKSKELMLAREAKYMEKLQEIEGVNTDVLSAMSSLYRAGWEDCWIAVAEDVLGKTR